MKTTTRTSNSKNTTTWLLLGLRMSLLMSIATSPARSEAGDSETANNPSSWVTQPEAKLQSKVLNEASCRLAFGLVDGSRIIGIPRIQSLPIKSPFAEVAVPWDQVVALSIHPDHKTVSLETKNGDKIAPIPKRLYENPIKAPD